MSDTTPNIGSATVEADFRFLLGSRDALGLSAGSVTANKDGGVTVLVETNSGEALHLSIKEDQVSVTGLQAKGCENLSFGQAIGLLREGGRLARKGWNGKNLFVVLMEKLNLPPYSASGTYRKVNDRTAKWIGEDTPLECQEYFVIYNSETNKWQPGWNPSTSDCLSNDWYLVQ